EQLLDIFNDSRKHERPHQVIFGDLNTMAHGIARFHPLYCKDHLRIMSFGHSEAEWLYEKVLSTDLNPGFYDPFELNEYTLEGYFGLYRGKLDWMLFKGFNVLSKGTDNDDFSASDHKLLYATATFSKENHEIKSSKISINCKKWIAG